MVSITLSTGGDQAYDGIVATDSKWTSDGTGAESWLALDLGDVQKIYQFVVYHAGAAGERTYYNTPAYRIEYGDTLNGPWQIMANVDNESRDNSTTTTLDTPLAARYIRLYITDAGIDDYARIAEFEIWGIAIP